MIRIAKFNEATINKARRILKVFVRSKIDVFTSYQVGQHGDDSCPVKDADLVHTKTATDDSVILGVISTNQKCNPGERRIFATDSTGVEKIDIYLRNDGTIEVGGTGDNFVKYTPLNSAMSQLILDINAELVKISAGVATGGGSYVVSPLSLNLSGAKTTKIKTQ